MARTRKNNAEYFSHDADASEDEKIIYLEAALGLVGYALYFKTLEWLCRCEGFEMPYNDVTAMTLARRFNVPLDQFQAFIVAATKSDVAALRCENGRLWSDGLKKRLEPLLDKRQKDAERLAQKRAEQAGKAGQAGAKTDKPLNGANVAATTDIDKDKDKDKDIIPPNPLKGEVGGVKKPKKEKPKKPTVRESIQVLPPEVEATLEGFDAPADARELWLEWLLYKHDEHGKRYKSAQTQAIALQKLLGLSDGNALKALAIVKESRAQGWAGLFPLKPAQHNGHNTNGHTSTTAPNGYQMSEGDQRALIAKRKREAEALALQQRPPYGN